MADEPDPEGKLRLEGEPGSLVVVLGMTCPECKNRLEFRAKDETPDGHLVCPHCGQVIVLSGDRLTGFQRKLDAKNAGIRALGQARADAYRTIEEGYRRLGVRFRRK